MSLIINGRFLTVNKPTGTHRAAFFLLRALAEIASDLLVICPGPIQFPEPLSPAVASAVRIHPGFLPLHRQLWEQFVFPRFKPDLWHVNLMGTSSFVFGCRRNLSLIYDLNYELLPESYDWRFRAWYRFACGVAAKRAARLVCDSEYTRTVIARILGEETAAKCRVLRLGPGIDPALLKPTEGLQKENYLLCVGSLQPHKNLLNLLHAFISLKSDYPNLKLKVVGRKQQKFDSLNIPKGLLDHASVDFTGYISDGTLAKLYQKAIAFVYPSFEEGFGLPVVEAFYAGCPVITSNCSCLPEIAGDAALLVDPLQPVSIAAAIRQVLEAPEIGRDLVARAKVRAARFTWSNAAADLLALIHEEKVFPTGEPSVELEHF